jgi:ketosteroid isomerase-like protein
MHDDAVRQADARFGEALTLMMQGDNAPLKSLLSHRPDATAFLGWGGYEQGGTELDERWDWAMAQFAAMRAQGRVMLSRETEYLSSVAHGDLGYTTAIERATFSRPGGGSTDEQVLRVTHIFRREDGDWKLVHRHVDRLAERREPI